MKRDLSCLCALLVCCIPTALTAQSGTPASGRSVAYSATSVIKTTSSVPVMGDIETTTDAGYTLALTAGDSREGGTSWSGSSRGEIRKMEVAGTAFELESATDDLVVRFLQKKDGTLDEFVATAADGGAPSPVVTGDLFGVQDRVTRVFLPAAWREKGANDQWWQTIQDTIIGKQAGVKGSSRGSSLQFVSAQVMYISDGVIDTLGEEVLRIRWRSDEVEVDTRFTAEITLHDNEYKWRSRFDTHKQEWVEEFKKRWHDQPESRNVATDGTMKAEGSMQGVAYYRLDDGMLLTSRLTTDLEGATEARGQTFDTKAHIELTVTRQ